MVSNSIMYVSFCKMRKHCTGLELKVAEHELHAKHRKNNEYPSLHVISIIGKIVSTTLPCILQ